MLRLTRPVLVAHSWKYRYDLALLQEWYLVPPVGIVWTWCKPQVRASCGLTSVALFWNDSNLCMLNLILSSRRLIAATVWFLCSGFDSRRWWRRAQPWCSWCHYNPKAARLFMFEKHDNSRYAHTILEGIRPLKRLRQYNLLSRAKKSSLRQDDCKSEMNTASDLLDALSRSCTLPIA